MVGAKRVRLTVMRPRMNIPKLGETACLADTRLNAFKDTLGVRVRGRVCKKDLPAGTISLQSWNAALTHGSC